VEAKKLTGVLRDDHLSFPHRRSRQLVRSSLRAGFGPQLADLG
jgi:hypothetical protein